MPLKIYISLIFLSLLFYTNLNAQTDGSWQPLGAQTSYPRTLLKAGQVLPVRQSLTTPPHTALYSGLYNSINTTPPATNTSADERRTRATFAKNTAFVIIMDRKPSADTLTSLSPEERTQFVTNVKSLLENINPAVEAVTGYTNWQWRSKELIDYMISYDLLRGAGEDETAMAASKAKLQEFAGNLYNQSVTGYLDIYYFYNNIKNNHALMTAAALGLSAVVLNDATSTIAAQQPINWINNGLYNIDNVLWRDAKRQSDSTAIAGYAEGPYYFKYAFLNVLPFIRAMGNFLPDSRGLYTYNSVSRSIRNPYYDPKYDLLYDWVSAILMPDGRYPALEDSYIDMGMPELALTGKSQYVQPLHLKNLAANQLNSLTTQLRDLTVDMRAAYLAANITPAEAAHNTLTALPKSGNLVFRSGNDSLANYLHLYGKNGLAQSVTGGHNHGDASSFILHAKGQLLALDAGYLSSSRRDSVGKATNHNLILVDGAGPAIGTDGTTNDAEAFIQHTFNTRQLAYGEVSTVYWEANITRKTLQVRKTYYLLADFVSAPAAHNYTWQLHGYGLEGGTATTGTFTDDLATQQEGTWQKNGVNLKAHVTATGGANTYSKATNIHEVTYNSSEKHTTLLVQQNGVAQTQFLSLLYPYTTTPATVTTTSTPTIAALAAADMGYKDIAWAQADTTTTTYANSSSPENITSDARLTFFSLDKADNFAQAFVEQGKMVQYGSNPVLQSTKRANISWQQTDAAHYEGYVSRSTRLAVALPAFPSVVAGANITEYSYDPEARTLAISFSGPSTFGVIIQDKALPVKLINFEASRHGQAVHIRWQTATENQNSGFTLLRKAEGAKNFENIGFVPGKGNSQTRNQYAFEDHTAPITMIYYRLVQTDFNGKTETSPLVAVPGQNTPHAQLEVAPVPATDYLQVNLRGAGPGRSLSLQLFSMDGKIALQHPFEGQINLDISALNPGFYFLRATDLDGRIITPGKKIMITR